jgi:branched-chain amino acid transport system substrate-binding protein
MGRISIFDQVVVDISPEELFAYLSGGNPDFHWLLGMTCDKFAPHQPVTFTIPLPGTTGENNVTGLGRITKVTPGRGFTLAHEMPWRGTVTCALSDVGSGTRVRLTADIDESSLSSVAEMLGLAVPPEAPDDRVRIGVIMSKSGPGSVFAAATEHLAEMAVEEINADADQGDITFSLQVADDRTNPVEAFRAAQRLVRAGVHVIISNVTSLSFESILAATRNSATMVIYTPINEGGDRGRGVFRLGERPAAQMHRSIPMLMQESGARCWYLAGNDYSWPQWTNRVARRYIESSGGQVVAETYRALGTRDFSSLIEKITRSGADAVLSTFVGADEVAFERQCFDSGLRTQIQTLSMALDESTRERIGDEAASGMWTSFGYFQCLESPENKDFLDRYKRRHGDFAPPISSISESVYEAIFLYAHSVREGHTPEPREVERRLRRSKVSTPRGVVDLSQRGHQNTIVGRAIPGGFAITA